MGEVFANSLIAGFRANSYYDTGTAQIKATSTGYSPEIQLRTDNGAIVFNRSTSASSDSVIAQSESLRIDASGSVGIGTSTPGYGATPGGSSGNGRTYLTVVGSSANSAAVIQLAANGGGQTPNGVLEFIDIGNTASSSLRAAFIYSGASGSAANNKGSFLGFATKADGVSGAGQVNMTLDSNGNLGVGTISPDVRLSVLGSVRVGTGSPTTGYTGIILASTATDTFTTNTDKVIHHYGITAKEFSDAAGAPSVVISGYAGLRFYTNGSESLRLDSNGNVGIGTTPSTWSKGRALELGTAGNVLWGYSGNIILSQNTSGYSTNFFYATDAAATRYQQKEGQHQWYIAPSGTAGTAISFTQAMTLDTSGNLALGLTSGNLSGYGAGVRVFTVQGNSLPGAIELALNSATGQNNTLGEINFVNNASTVTSKQSAYITGFQDGTSTTAPGGGIRFTTRTDGGSLAERLRINNAGNVGVGSTNPAYKLHIEGTDPWLAIRDNRTQSAGLGGVLAFQGYTNGVTNPATFSSILGRKENSTSADGAGYLTLFTSNTAGIPVERLRIDSTGNVGIGDSTPTATGGALSILTTSGSYNALILGDTNAYNAAPMAQLHFRLKVNSSNGTASVAYIKGAKENSISGDNSGYLAFHTSSASSVVERVRIDSSGSLLVGTAASTYGNTGRGLIEINGTNDVVLGLRIGGVAKGYVQVNVNNDFVIVNQSNSTMSFVNNGLERVRISTGGTLLVTGGIGLGYGPGAGGVVVQSTNKSTAVTLNKPSGQVTLSNAALAANATVAFPLSNSTIAANDTVQVNLKSGYATSATYQVWAEGISAGACAICVRNISGGSLSEALVLNFTVTKGAVA